jgi:hypothetical protein
MLLYVLIGLCLALVGVAGLQLMYMLYLDRMDRERRKRIRELERRCKTLTFRLADAERYIEDQRDLIGSAFSEADGEEAWADVIDER